MTTNPKDSILTQIPENPEEEFQFYIRFAKPLAIKIRSYNDRINASKWLTRLENETDPKLKNDYLKLLLFAMQRPGLLVPFNSPPSGDPLETIEGLKITDMAVKLLEDTQAYEKALYGSGDFGPRCFVETSADDRQYVSYQEIPNFGVHCFFAISNNEPISEWISSNYSLPPGSKSKDSKLPSNTLSNSKVSPEGGTKLPRWIERMTRTLEDDIELTLEPIVPGSKSPPRTPTRQREPGTPRCRSPPPLIEFSPQQVRPASYGPINNDDHPCADDFEFGGNMDFQNVDQFFEYETHDQAPMEQTVCRSPEIDVDWRATDQYQRFGSIEHQTRSKSPMRTNQPNNIDQWNDYIPGARGPCGATITPTFPVMRQNASSPAYVDEWANSIPVARKLNFDDENISIPLNNEETCASNAPNAQDPWDDFNTGDMNFDMGIAGPSRNRSSSPTKCRGARSRSSSPKPGGRGRSKSPGPSSHDAWDDFQPGLSDFPLAQTCQRSPRSSRQPPPLDAWDDFQPGIPEGFQRCSRSPRQIAPGGKLDFDEWSNFVPSVATSPKKNINSPQSPCDFDNDDFQFEDAAGIIDQEKEDDDVQWPFDDVEVERAQDLLHEFNIEDYPEQYSPKSPCRTIRDVTSASRLTYSMDGQGMMRDGQGNVMCDVKTKMKDPDGTELTFRRRIRRDVEEGGICETPTKGGGKRVPRRLTFRSCQDNDHHGVEVEQLYINPSVRNSKRHSGHGQPCSAPQTPMRGPGRYSIPVKLPCPSGKRAAFDHRHSPLADTSPIRPVDSLPEEEQGFKWLDTYPRNIFWNIKDKPPKMTTAQMKHSIREGTFSYGSRIPYAPPPSPIPPPQAPCYSPRTPPSGRLSPSTPPNWIPRTPVVQTTRSNPRSMELAEGGEFGWSDNAPTFCQQDEYILQAEEMPETPARQEIYRRYYRCRK